jgi:hypothetical protein
VVALLLLSVAARDSFSPQKRLFAWLQQTSCNWWLLACLCRAATALLCLCCTDSSTYSSTYVAGYITYVTCPHSIPSATLVCCTPPAQRVWAVCSTLLPSVLPATATVYPSRGALHSSLQWCTSQRPQHASVCRYVTVLVHVALAEPMCVAA